MRHALQQTSLIAEEIAGLNSSSELSLVVLSSTTLYRILSLFTHGDQVLLTQNQLNGECSAA